MRSFSFLKLPQSLGLLPISKINFLIESTDKKFKTKIKKKGNKTTQTRDCE